MTSDAHASHQRSPIGFYDRGPTPFFALQYDPRLSYCLFVPTDYAVDGDTIYDLLVVVHGTERGAAYYRDGFADFATKHQAIVLAPLFPANLFFIGDLENYKMLRAGDLRFDLALLAMVDEVAAKYRLSSDRFLLHGFSGGGHFAHRFLYTHPDRILAVSIGAPGVVTLFDQNLNYPLGLKGMAEFLGGTTQPDIISDVPVQCIVGADDTDTWEITVEPDEVYWTPGINDTGRTRIDRIRTLAASLRKAGCEVQLDIVDGVDHDEIGLVPTVLQFLETQLTQKDR